jgi:hypothetical protein
LISLWTAYNHYLVHVIARLPSFRRETVCRIGSGEPVTLHFPAEDYLTHMVDHLRQIGVRDPA